MKRFYNVLAIMLACVFAVGMTACEGTGGGGGLTVNPAALEFTAAGGTEYVTVTGSDWTVTNNTGWITAVKEGNAVKVTVGAATAARTGSFTVASSTDSKVVTVVQAEPGSQFIDELVGTWEAAGHLWIQSETEGTNVYPDEHEVIITKIDNTTILISGFLGLDELYSNNPTTDEVLGTVNNEARTFSIASQEMEPTWDADGWPVRWCSMVSLTFADCWDVGFENLKVENGVIALWKDGALRGTVDGMDSFCSMVGLTQEPGTTNIYWYGWNYANTEWIKISNSTSFNYVNKPKVRVEISKTRINQASL